MAHQNRTYPLVGGRLALAFERGRYISLGRHSDNPRAKGGGMGSREPLGGSALEAAAFPLGEAAPDTKSLVMREGIFQAFAPDFAREADSLRFAR